MWNTQVSWFMELTSVMEITHSGIRVSCVLDHEINQFAKQLHIKYHRLSLSVLSCHIFHRCVWDAVILYRVIDGFLFLAIFRRSCTLDDEQSRDASGQINEPTSSNIHEQEQSSSSSLQTPSHSHPSSTMDAEVHRRI